jgi:dihydroorotate dehydrogenase (fumarate)
MNGEDAVKMLLAGASCVQVVSTLYKNKVTALESIVKGIETWMDKKGYENISDFQGKLSKKNSSDPAVYKRAQYVKLLLKPEIITENYPVM